VKGIQNYMATQAPDWKSQFEMVFKRLPKRKNIPTPEG
jgi:hypothetical protein